ncbi:hypothetical protein ACZ90_22910 [Streptomyces albus subsp. albus]|nr:hypothetical protein ACZ90_22910 [Streptomyces albus subsp. albus]
MQPSQNRTDASAGHGVHPLDAIRVQYGPHTIRNGCYSDVVVRRQGVRDRIERLAVPIRQLAHPGW